MNEGIDPHDVELIERYLGSLRFANRSQETIKIRASYLRKAAREVGLHGDSLVDLRHKYQQWLMRPSVQPQTRALWITVLHQLYKFANQEGIFRRVEAPNGALVDFDPTIGLSKPKTKKGKPHPIPEDDLARAVTAANSRMRCWLLLAAACGLRCKEIALLEREAIDDQEGILHLEHTKGEKPRDVPLFPEVYEALLEFGLPKSGRLWQVSPAQVSRQGNEFLRAQGAASTMHSLRHRALTQIYQSTGDAFYTADIAGHSSTEITRVYSKPADRSKDPVLLEKLRVVRAKNRARKGAHA